MRTVFMIAVFVFSLVLVNSAQSIEFYHWVDENGTLVYTDDPKLIPINYLDSVVKRDTQELTMGIEDQFPQSEEVTTRLNHLRQLRSEVGPNPNRLNDCTGFVAVHKIRMREGKYEEYDRTKVVAIDECGRVVSVSGQYPEIRINR